MISQPLNGNKKTPFRAASRGIIGTNIKPPAVPHAAGGLLLDRIFQWTVTFLPTCCVGDPLECSVFRFFKPSSHFWISRLEQTLAQRYFLRLLCLLKHVWNEPRLPFTLRSQSRKVLGLRSSIFLEDCTV